MEVIKKSKETIDYIRFAAFTIAEVLIVLGIIGVVAELTIPTLARNIEQQVLKTQLKKSYSTLSQVISKAQADFGTNLGCYYWRVKTWQGTITTTYNDDGTSTNTFTYPDGHTSTTAPPDYNGIFTDCSNLKTSFDNNLAISKYCPTNALSQGCISGEFKGLDEVYAANSNNLYSKCLSGELASSTCNGDESCCHDYAGAAGTSQITNWKKDKIQNYDSAYVLKDGTIIVLYGKDVISKPLFLVDVNGNKKPNKWGYDIFYMKATGYPLRLDCNDSVYAESGGKSCASMLQSPVQ